MIDISILDEFSLYIYIYIKKEKEKDREGGEISKLETF